MNVEQIFWYVSITAEAVACGAFVFRGVALNYPFFTCYLAITACSGVALRMLSRSVGTHTYARDWMIAEPILLAFLAMATEEIVGKIPEHYRGFGSFGRRKLRRLLQFALAVALISSVLEAAGPHWTWSSLSWLPFVIALHRIITSTLAVYLILVAVFVSNLPVPFRRNLVVHSRLLASYLALQTAVMLWINIAAGGRGTDFSNLTLLGGSTVLFLLWAALLTRVGETLPAAKTMTQVDIVRNQQREKALREAAQRYSDGRLG